MKESNWDDKSTITVEGAKDFFDSMALMEDDENVVVSKSDKLDHNRHVTEMRRRIEERLDGKRIDHQFDYDYELD